MAGVKFKDLLGTGAHFGHVTRKWHPNYKPYILMEKNGVHIINLEETVRAINKATNFIKDVIKKNGEILFVGTKKQARDIVQEEADRCRMFYIVERWLGGTLTNFSTIKKSIKRLRLLEKEGSSLYSNTITKKETQMLNRERIKLADQHRGIKDMRRLPDAIVVVDTNYEETAIREAKSLDIPVVAIVDTNSDPVAIDYPIPANDDSIRTIQLIISAISEEIIQAKGFGKDELDSKGELSAPVDGSTKPVVKETVDASEGESYVKNIENSTEEKPIEEEE